MGGLKITCETEENIFLETPRSSISNSSPASIQSARWPDRVDTCDKSYYLNLRCMFVHFGASSTVRSLFASSNCVLKRPQLRAYYTSSISVLNLRPQYASIICVLNIRLDWASFFQCRSLMCLQIHVLIFSDVSLVCLHLQERMLKNVFKIKIKYKKI